MGIYNRDYMRDDGGSGSGVHIRGPRHWSPVTWLIVLNVGWFLIHYIFVQPNPAGQRLFGGIWKPEILNGKVYLLLTYLFVHGNLWHLLMNMLGLFFVGRMLLASVGSRRFLKLYFLGGIFAGLVTLAAHWISPVNTVGASGAVLAVVTAVCFGFGELQGRLIFPPITFKFKYIGWIIVGIEIARLILVFTTGRSTFAQKSAHGVDVYAHLGGIVAGLFFWKVFMRERESSGYQDSFSRQGIPDFTPEKKSKKPKPKRRREKKAKPFVSKDVDAILDKINAEGIHSLSPQERKILDQRSDELSKRLDE